MNLLNYTTNFPDTGSGKRSDMILGFPILIFNRLRRILNFQFSIFKFQLPCVIALLIVFCPHGKANPLNFANRDTVFVSDFGLKPDSRENATPYVQKALQACAGKSNPVLVFPKGRYDFWTQHCTERVYFESNTVDVNPKRLAILIEQIDGLTIDCGNSEFIFHDRIQPFTIDNCRNVTVKNGSIDWEITLIAQGEVVATTDNYIDLRINKTESPYIIEKNRLVFVGEGWKSEWWGTMEFEKSTHTVAYLSGDGSLGNGWEKYRAEEISSGLVRLHNQFKRKPAVGNWLILRHSTRDHAGIFIQNSRNVSVENMNMYHYCGLGILSQYSENLTFTGVNCAPNKEKGRIFSGFADGFQYSNCKGNVVVKNCVFHALMDDPINVHGTSVRVMERVDNFTLRCKFMHNESLGMTWAYPGDSVGFINNKSMQTYSTGIVKSFRKIDTELFEVSFHQAIPAEFANENALENLTWTCNVSITDSKFKSCRARGLLISTPGKVTVENNMFESSGAAILISGDANYWYESGAVKDVRIARNVFTAPCLTSMYGFCEGVISISPVIPEKDERKPAFHRNIVITENEFHLFDYPVLYALSVDNLEFSNNKLIRSYDFEPFHGRKYGLTFEYCKNVTVKGNIREGEILGNTVSLVHTPAAQCRIDKKSFFKIVK